MTIDQLQRVNIRDLAPYSCARSEFKGEASVYLDANENPLNDPYNRYPDPLQMKVKEKIAKLKGVRPSQIMLGNGSDEPIDLTIRIFCEPKVDNMVSIDPTYGMYKVCADINQVEYRDVLLNSDFTLDFDRLMAATDEHTKVIFLCSPNNPTGNLIDRDVIHRILNAFEGIVVIDEAYADFASEASWLEELDRYPRMVILQTFSKAWASASVRCGMAFGSEEVIACFNKVKYPYNVNLLTQRFVSEQLDYPDRKESWVKMLIEQRDLLRKRLAALPFVEEIYPSDANFLLVKMKEVNRVYGYLQGLGIIVRNRNNVSLCRGCLRITVGTAEEMDELLDKLKSFS